MFEKNAPMIDSHFHIRGGNGEDLSTLLDVSSEIERKLNLEAVCVAAIPAWDHESVGQNVLCALYKALHPNSYAYAGLDHYAPDTDRTPEGYLAQARLFEAMGFDGIKSIELKPTARRMLGVGIDDPCYEPCFAYWEANGTPILWHVADPEENWFERKCSPFVIEAGWCYEHGPFLSKEALYKETEAVLARHPRLNVVFAHLYFLAADLPRLCAFLDAHPSVRVDVTPGSEMYYHFGRNRDAWRAFFIQYSNRVVFGTDNGWGDEASPAQKVIDGCGKILLLDAFFSTNQPVTFWDGTLIRGLDLPNEALEHIYSGNFLDMQRSESPRALDLHLAAEYARDLYKRVQNMSDLSFDKREQLRCAAEWLMKLAHNGHAD